MAGVLRWFQADSFDYHRIIRMNKNFSFEKVLCSYDHMSLSRDRIWHYFSMKPYTEIATTTFVLDKNRTEKTNFPI